MFIGVEVIFKCKLLLLIIIIITMGKMFLFWMISVRGAHTETSKLSRVGRDTWVTYPPDGGDRWKGGVVVDMESAQSPQNEAWLSLNSAGRPACLPMESTLRIITPARGSDMAVFI